ncbi:cytochrome c3 family protein [Bdellovibrionota bacterium FG-2]
MLKFISLFVGTFAVFVGVASVAYSEDNPCLGCHAKLAQSEHVHYPVSNNYCDACHTVQPEHLTTQKKEYVSTDPSNDTCYNCHEPMDSGPVVHKAIEKKNGCTYCHNPHGGARRSFLRDEPGKLCTSCHTGLIPEGSSKHGALDFQRSCLICHVPHSSPNKRLLTAQGGDCFSCHDQKLGQTPNMKQAIGDLPLSHKPAKDGKCIACHTPHASQLAPLIRNQSGSSKPNWNSNLVTICLQCHQALVSSEFVSASETRFRKDEVVNGKTTRLNLHFLHVVKKGRSCTVCHNVHGGVNAHNIASDESPLKKRKFEFLVSPQGGTCAHACHGNANYRRL